jgi:hypothetical protein
MRGAEYPSPCCEHACCSGSYDACTGSQHHLCDLRTDLLKTAPAQTPAQARQALAAALVGSVNDVIPGTWDNDADITIVSASVSMMCSSDTGRPYSATTGQAPPSCSGVVPGQIPITDWNQPGVVTAANAEAQMSDGTQEAIAIVVTDTGTLLITWPGREG